MATYYKPQSPIQSGEDFIYPITTADQIMKSDKSRRLEQAGLIVADNSTKLGGKAPEYYIQPRNLLDNGDFSNLIAQAGLNGAHGSTAYIADRWISLGASATQQNGYTTLSTTKKSGRISQKLPDALAGKTVTAAAKVSGNSIVYCGIYYSQNSVSKSIAVNVSAPNGIMTKSGTIPADATGIEFRIYIAYTDGGGSCNVYWAALYEGSYTAETLPPYVPKGYAEEMAECQRYYQIIRLHYHLSTIYDNQYRYYGCSLPVKMRTTPTVTIESMEEFKVNSFDKNILTSYSGESYSSFEGMAISFICKSEFGTVLSQCYVSAKIACSADL